MSAGLAATGAAFVTSRFGVAGTLLGAALTAIIITGGSAILRGYIEGASSRVRDVPTRLLSWGQQRKAGHSDQPQTLPGRPDLRAKFIGRMRAALGWFSNLPALQRCSILVNGLMAAAVAFALCMVAIWGVEKIIGNSFSCGFWGTCPVGAVPGIHLAGYDGTDAGSSITGGDVGTAGGAAGGASPQRASSTVGRTLRSSGESPASGNPIAAGSPPLPNPMPWPPQTPPPSPAPLRTPDKSPTLRGCRRPLTAGGEAFERVARSGSVGSANPSKTPAKRGFALVYRMPAGASAVGSLVGPEGESHGDHANQVHRAVHPGHGGTGVPA